MLDVQFVTDSWAHFPKDVQLSSSVTILPNTLTIGGRIYHEGVDLHADEIISLLNREKSVPSIQAPSPTEFAQAYLRASRAASAIVSIHPSREISPSFDHGRAAAQQLAGRCPVILIDSRSLSAGQGLLVQIGIQTVFNGASLEDVERTLRGAIDRLYFVFCVETTDHLLHHQLIEPGHALMCAMLGLRPVLTIENGRIAVMEKVRTRAQAIERLAEFAVEFDQIESAILLQPRSAFSDLTRMLQERLALEFGGSQFPYMAYGPSLAALVGADAIGLVVLERETARIDNVL
ncbi:MAG: DegV family protein [Aggregatilineales bacterium]